MMTKKTAIAIDYDEVLFPFIVNLVIYHNSKYGSSLSFNDFTGFKYQPHSDKIADAHDKMKEFARSQEYMFIDPLPGAREALHDLSNMFDFHLVTARDVETMETVETMLEKHFSGMFKGLHFLGAGDMVNLTQSKLDLCANLGVSILVDDSVTNFELLDDFEIDGILFGEYPWNKKEHPESLIRITDWAQLHGFLKNYEQNNKPV